jgi:hypothetical protein
MVAFINYNVYSLIGLIKISMKINVTLGKRYDIMINVAKKANNM